MLKLLRMGLFLKYGTKTIACDLYGDHTKQELVLKRFALEAMENTKRYDLELVHDGGEHYIDADLFFIDWMDHVHPEFEGWDEWTLLVEDDFGRFGYLKTAMSESG